MERRNFLRKAGAALGGAFLGGFTFTPASEAGKAAVSFDGGVVPVAGGTVPLVHGPIFSLFSYAEAKSDANQLAMAEMVEFQAMQLVGMPEFSDKYSACLRENKIADPYGMSAVRQLQRLETLRLSGEREHPQLQRWNALIRALNELGWQAHSYYGTLTGAEKTNGATIIDTLHWGMRPYDYRKLEIVWEGENPTFRMTPLRLNEGPENRKVLKDVWEGGAADVRTGMNLHMGTRRWDRRRQLTA